MYIDLEELFWINDKFAIGDNSSTSFANSILCIHRIKNRVERLKSLHHIRDGKVSIIAKDNVFSIEIIIEEFGHIGKCNVSYGVDNI